MPESHVCLILIKFRGPNICDSCRVCCMISDEWMRGNAARPRAVQTCHHWCPHKGHTLDSCLETIFKTVIQLLQFIPDLILGSAEQEKSSLISESPLYPKSTVSARDHGTYHYIDVIRSPANKCVVIQTLRFTYVPFQCFENTNKTEDYSPEWMNELSSD